MIRTKNLCRKNCTMLNRMKMKLIKVYLIFFNTSYFREIRKTSQIRITRTKITWMLTSSSLMISCTDVFYKFVLKTILKLKEQIVSHRSTSKPPNVLILSESQCRTCPDCLKQKSFSVLLQCYLVISTNLKKKYQHIVQH